MPDVHIPIDQILSGHQQSLFKTLRFFDRPTHNTNRAPSFALLLQFLQSSESTDLANRSESFVALAELLHRQRSGTESVALKDSSELVFIDLLLRQIWESIKPHPGIRVPAQKFFWIMGFHFLQRPDLAISDEHPYTQLLNSITQEICIWEPTTGRLANRIPQQLEELTTQIARQEIKSRTFIEHIIAKFQQSIDEQKQRAETLESRQLQSEFANLDTDKARQSVINYIDLRLSGKPLPKPVISFIVSTLVNDLQFVTITQGVESPLLKRWKRLIQVLSWVFLPQDNHRQQHKISTLLIPLIEQLDENFYSDFPAPQIYHAFFDQLTEYLICVLQKKSIECIEFQAINPSSEQKPKTIVDQNLISNLDNNDVGDWYFLTIEEITDVKAKLILKDSKNDIVCFSDYMGRIVKKYTFEGFSLALAINAAQPIKRKDLYRLSLRGTLVQLDKKYQELRNKDHIKREIENQKQSSLKALYEAEALARRPGPQENQNYPDPSTLQTFEHQLSTLNTGSWLLLRNDKREAKKIRLSVKLQAQDKYIFTDSVGHRVAEFSLSSLVDYMASGQLEILSRVQGFENSLEKVVRQIRSDKS